MRYQTHVVFCIFLSLLVSRIIPIQNQALFIIISIFFTLLPDIDESSSKIGRKTKPISFFLKHRGFFHSLWIPLILVFALYPLSFEISLAIFIGYFSHLILDSFTKEGIRFVYPFRWRVRGFAKTGGLLEKTLFIILVVLIIFMIL